MISRSLWTGPLLPTLSVRQIDLLVEFAVRFAFTMTPEHHERFRNEALPHIRKALLSLPAEDRQIMEIIVRRVGEELSGVPSKGEKTS